MTRPMHTSPTSRALALAVFGVLSSSAYGAAAPQAVEALTNRGPLVGVTLPAHAKAGSGLQGTLNPAVMNGAAVSITLPDGRVIEARVQRQASNARNGTQSWIGTFSDAPGSVLVLSKAKGVITGVVNYKDMTLEIRPATGGKHMLFAVDNARLPGDLVEMPKQVADATGTTSDFGLGGSTLAAGDTIVHDVLVVYTAAAAAANGQANLESMIQNAVQSANQAYLNSQVAITMNLVGTQQVSVTEGSSMSATKSALQSDSAVANLRNQLGADVVMLVSQNSDYCGLANVMLSNSTSFASSAYGVVYSACLSNQSLAHEVGHIQGLMHDRANSPASGAYPYGFGYRVCVSDGTGFRDVMSYSCSGAPRVLLFSNPNVTYNGHAAGVSYELSPSTSAENARAMSNTAATVAAFRSAVTTSTSPPAAPTALTTPTVTYNAVSLSWSDNSTNESGFKVERSADGVVFSEVGTLGADTRSFNDPTVSKLTTYYYRVRAFNGSGGSAYSNTVSAKTPDAPPPPPSAPTSVSAVDDKDGTATVVWVVGASTAASFEVRRETWDSRKNAWTAGATVATVPSNVLSIDDKSGAGTFRYSVRATNSGGVSGYAGPVSVTVTASVTSTKKTPPGKR